jgi:predicted nucleic acid-binding protein
VKAVFADTFFYIALLDEKDAAFDRVRKFADTYKGFMVTSRWVLLELANALSADPLRSEAAVFLTQLENEPSVKIVSAEDRYFRSGLELYASRKDKRWSLTDCISFMIMQIEGIHVALTGDHHFAQAGFVPVFADPQ